MYMHLSFGKKEVSKTSKWGSMPHGCAYGIVGKWFKPSVCKTVVSLVRIQPMPLGYNSVG